jgi:hypothetical protein
MDPTQVAEINAAIAKAEQGGDIDSANQLRAYLKQTSPAPATAADKQAIPSADYTPNFSDESQLLPGAGGAALGVYKGGKFMENVGEKILPQPNAPVAVQKQFVSPADVEARINARPVATPSVSVTGISDADLAARKTPGASGAVNYGKVMPGQVIPDVIANQIQTMDKVNEKGAYKIAARDAANLEKIKAIGEGNQKLMNVGGTQLMLPESTTTQLTAEQNAAQQAAKEKAVLEQGERAKDVAKVRAERLMEREALKGKFGAQVKAEVEKLKHSAPMKYIGKIGEAARVVTEAPLVTGGLRLASGFGAGVGAGEAYDRLSKGQNIRGGLSAVGAVGDLAAMSRNPYGMVLGGAAGVGAPLLNRYLDKLAEEHPEMAERIGLADGGSVHSGGITKDELEFIHHLRALHAKKSK